MAFDEHGTLWLTDPWVALAGLVVAVGVVLWSHGWIATGAPPRPKAMAVRLRHDSRIGLARARQMARAALPAHEAAPRRAAGATVVRLPERTRSRTAA
jgi:hypothetical protein